MSSRKQPEQQTEQDTVSNKRSRFEINQLLSDRGPMKSSTPSSTQSPGILNLDDQQPNDAVGLDNPLEQPSQPFGQMGQELPRATGQPVTSFQSTSIATEIGRATTHSQDTLSHHSETDVSPSAEQKASEQPDRVLLGASTRKGAKLATKLLGKAVGVCKIGPLQDISNMLQNFADMHITEVKVKSEHQALQKRLQTLLKAVEEHFDGSTSPAVMSKIESIRDFIEGELNSLAGNQSRNQHRNFLMAKEDEERFLACHHQVREYMELLSLDTSISRWEMEEQQLKDRMSTLTYHLPSSPSAWYDSSAGEELRRRECTSGTRVQVLTNLLDWIESDRGGVYWLNGMAGTGKTTIAYSVCKELDARRNLAGSFFCSRLREECRNISNIIPSIAYQLARFSPSFGSALSAVLGRDADAHTKRLPTQFRALIREPLLVARPLPADKLVVVIDALDECENKESSRNMLNLLLNEAADLPIKFLVSSRPEPQIRDQMTDERVKSRLVLHELDKAQVQEDVGTYLREGLAPINPSDEQVAALVGKTGILFIYAATAVRYIGYDNFQSDPMGRLGDILNGPQSPEDRGNEDDIDQLYMTILDAALGNRSLRKVQRDDMRQVINTVICAREPLTVRGLSGLLGLNNIERVRAALRPLWSVLHVVGTNELVTTLHASFPDFMFDLTRSKTYYCDLNLHHKSLSEHCFEYIKQTRPEFNICRLDSSYICDDEILDIDKRVANAIPSELLYACRYWMDHAKAANCVLSVIEQVRDFLSTRLLLWMEVMNLKNQMGVGLECVKLLVEWCKFKGQEELDELAHDAKRFVDAFASNSVSRSTPHIYISMLAFWPKSTPISKCYAKYARGPVTAEGSALDRRQLVHLSTWAFGTSIWAIAVSPDGLHLAIATFNNILVVDSSSGRVILGPLEGLTERANSIAFSPSGDRVICVSCLNGNRVSSTATVVWWDTRTGEIALGPLELHRQTNWISCLSISPDGSHIVTGYSDNIIRLWDAQTGAILHQFEVEDQTNTTSTVFSSDGTRVVVGAGKALYSLDIRTGEPSHTRITHTDSFELIALSPDQSRLISRGRERNVIYVRNAFSGDIIQALEGHTNYIGCIGYSPDGRFIVSGSCNRTVRVWDAQSGNMVLGPLEGHTNFVDSVAFSSDGSRIISACKGGLVCTWDAQQRSLTSDSTNSLADHITCAKFSFDGARFVTGSEGGTICIRDSYTGDIALGPLKAHKSRVNAVDFKHNYVVSCSEDGEICVYNTLTGQFVLGPLQVGSRAIRTVTYSHDARLIAAVTSAGVDVRNAQDGSRVLGPLTDLNSVSSVQFSPAGTRIVASSNLHKLLGGATIVVWDVSDGRNVFGSLDGHDESVYSVSFSPNGSLIASGSYDGTIILWDAYTGKKVLGPLIGPGYYLSAIHSVSFSPNSTRLVSGSDHGTIRIWDVQMGEVLFELINGHKNAFKSVEYSPDGNHIMSLSSDMSVRIHDARSPAEKAYPRSESETGEWTIRKDGWVVDNQSRLLVWVPGDLWKALMWLETRVMIAPQGCVRLKFDKPHMGESWAQSYTS